MKSSWPSSTPALKNSNARGLDICGSPIFASEAEAVEQAEDERDEPRIAFRQPRYSPTAAQDFRGDEYDAERDGGLDGGLDGILVGGSGG
jgi:hypothetical protein